MRHAYQLILGNHSPHSAVLRTSRTPWSGVSREAAAAAPQHRPAPSPAEASSPMAPSPEMDFDPGHSFDDDLAAPPMPAAPAAPASRCPCPLAATPLSSSCTLCMSLERQKTNALVIAPRREPAAGTGFAHIAAPQHQQPLPPPPGLAPPPAKKARGERWGAPIGQGGAAGEAAAAPSQAYAAAPPAAAALPPPPPLAAPHAQPWAMPPQQEQARVAPPAQVSRQPQQPQGLFTQPQPQPQQEDQQRKPPQPPPTDGARRAQEIAARLMALHGDTSAAGHPPHQPPPQQATADSSADTAAAAPGPGPLPPAWLSSSVPIQQLPALHDSSSSRSGGGGYQSSEIPGLQAAQLWAAPLPAPPSSPPADAGTLLLKLLAPEAAAQRERPRAGAAPPLRGGSAEAAAPDGPRPYSTTRTDHFAPAPPGPPGPPGPPSRPPPPAQVPTSIPLHVHDPARSHILSHFCTLH